MIFFEPGRRKACRKRLSNFLARLLLLLYAFSHLNNMKNRGSRGVSSCGEQGKRGRERMDRWMYRWERGERSDRPVERVRAGGQRYAYRHTQRHAPNLKFKFGTSHGTASYTGYSHARASYVFVGVRVGVEEEEGRRETRRKGTSDEKDIHPRFHRGPLRKHRPRGR